MAALDPAIIQCERYRHWSNQSRSQQQHDRRKKHYCLQRTGQSMHVVLPAYRHQSIDSLLNVGHGVAPNRLISNHTQSLLSR